MESKGAKDTREFEGVQGIARKEANGTRDTHRVLCIHTPATGSLRRFDLKFCIRNDLQHMHLV